MSKVRIAFLGTPEFATVSLKMLLQDDHFEIVGVVTQPDRPAGRNMKLQPSPVKQLALENNLKVITPENINSTEVLAEITSWRAESAVVVAFGQIFKNEILSMFPMGMVNLHASLLPRWRGAAPIQRTIEAGDREAGITLQILVDRLDAGPILGTKKLLVTDDMDAKELHDRLAHMGALLLHVEFMDYLRGNLSAVPQDEVMTTYAKKIQKSESEINWNRPAREIFNRIRAFSMGPGTHTLFEGKKLKIHKAIVCDRNVKSNKPGEIIEIKQDSFVVSTCRNALEVTVVQPESRARQTASEFLRGHSLKTGVIVGQ